MENWSLARSSLLSVRELPNQFSDDTKHKQKAEQLLEELPDLEAEDIVACLRYASRRIDHPVLAA